MTVHSGLAEEPLAAFKEDARPVIPEWPQASILPQGELLPPRPDLAALVAEFHQMGSGGAFNSVENVGPQLDDDKAAARHMLKEEIGVKNTEKSARRVLGELNR